MKSLSPIKEKEDNIEIKITNLKHNPGVIFHGWLIENKVNKYHVFYK